MKLMQTSLVVTAILLTLLLHVCTATAEAPPGMANATFVVHCYDVGAHTLEDKPGVLAVERGWSGSREVDRVVYNPEEVSIIQLEAWLKASGTYVRTEEQATSTEPAKEMSQ
jgi:hypothetical protein